jgi:hypothetical protein
MNINLNTPLTHLLDTAHASLSLAIEHDALGRNETHNIRLALQDIIRHCESVVDESELNQRLTQITFDHMSSKASKQ